MNIAHIWHSIQKRDLCLFFKKCFLTGVVPPSPKTDLLRVSSSSQARLLGLPWAEAELSGGSWVAHLPWGQGFPGEAMLQVGPVLTTLFLQMFLGGWRSVSLRPPKWVVRGLDVISEPTSSVKRGHTEAAQTWEIFLSPCARFHNALTSSVLERCCLHL